MAVSLPRFVDVYALFAIGNSHPVWPLGHLGWHSLRNNFRARHFAGSGNSNRRVGRSLCVLARRKRLHTGAFLAAVEDSGFPVRLRLDARNASAFPVRPTDVFRLEIAAAGFHRKRDSHELRHPGKTAMGREMTASLVVFFVLAALAVIGALSLIIQKHPIHSALSLIVVMIALAGLYLLLGAEFVAAVQIIVYGGAIMVLFVFVIMLLNAGIEEHTSISKMAGAPGLLLVVALAGFVAATIARSTENIQATSQTGELASTKEISGMIFKDFVYPFELTSFLILIAILGATVLAQREKS